MFTLNKCLVHSCKNLSISVFDKTSGITEERGYCLNHTPDPGRAKESIYDYIKMHDVVVGLNAAGIMFRDIDLSDKRFYGCNFQHCTFSALRSEGLLGKLCMFDFASFTDCTLAASTMQFTSFACAAFSHTIFTGSDMVQNNFNGVYAFQSSFDDSDLYNSRFIGAHLVDTSLRNCNIKNTLFLDCVCENVSMKMSNTREAVFDRKGSELFQGIESKNRVPV